MLARTRFLSSYRSWIEMYHKVDGKMATMGMASAATTKKQDLPHLPVPKLNQTVEKYLKSVEPFLNETELKKTKTLFEQFQSESGVGTKLQKLLVQKAKETDNWLAEWWSVNAYLGYRDPVVVYSSPGLVFPFEKFGSETDLINYTAKLISGALSYKAMVDKEDMKVDMQGKDPLDMNQYKKIFGTCRIPGLKQDHLEYNPQSKHIAIVRNNNFFKLQVIDDDGVIMSTKELGQALAAVIAESEDQGPPIGILTTDNRNNWGKAYQDLTLDYTNLKSVREIQTSLFLVSIDQDMDLEVDSKENVASKQLIHGGGSEANSANRWYDKTVQFIVSQNGIVGLTYEHSPAEGQPIAVMTDYVVDLIRRGSGSEKDSNMCTEPIKLNFNLDKDIQAALDCASANIDKLACNLDMEAFKYTCYGKEFVKSHKMSPDSYLQIAMQFAFYRLYKVPGAHYESAAVRKYIHGRTETIRSCSNESIAFAKAMLDCSKTDQERVTALQQAVNAHKKYSIEAVNGFGVDRHLLGLKLIALENNLPVPEIFKDPSYTRSTYMRLSTSQVATKCDGFMCYAALVPDGYGCCYNPRKNDMNFAVSAFAEHPDTTAVKFREALEESLTDMHHILATTQKSKL